MLKYSRWEAEKDKQIERSNKKNWVSDDEFFSRTQYFFFLSTRWVYLTATSVFIFLWWNEHYFRRWSRVCTTDTWIIKFQCVSNSNQSAAEDEAEKKIKKKFHILPHIRCIVYFFYSLISISFALNSRALFDFLIYGISSFISISRRRRRRRRHCDCVNQFSQSIFLCSRLARKTHISCAGWVRCVSRI